MKFSLAIMAAAALMAVPAFAQAPASGTPAKPPVHHQPGVAAQTTQAAPKAPATGAPAAEKLDPAKEAAIRHLLDVTQTSKMGDAIKGAITNQVQTVMSRTISPEDLPKFMDTFNQKFDASAPSSAVTDAIVPIYAAHFSIEEIQGITQFYESPVGQSLVKEMPDVVQESRNAGFEMDQKVMLEVLRSMADDYPQLKALLPPEETPAPAPGAAPAPAAPSSGPAPAPATPPATAPAPAPAPAQPQK